MSVRIEKAFMNPYVIRLFQAADLDGGNAEPRLAGETDTNPESKV